MKKWRECLRWLSDDMPETTPSIIMISKKGKVKRLAYKYWGGTNYVVRKENIYALSTNRGKQRHENDVCLTKGKYQHVSIQNKAYSVHRLVAVAFVPNPENKPQVNHIDGNRSNNHYKNLEWVTNAENMRHAHKTGLIPKRYKYEKITTKQKKKIAKLLTKGVSPTRISKKLKGKLSHETLREYKNTFFSGVVTSRKKRERKSDEYYKIKAKETRDNREYSSEIISEIVQKYEAGYLKSELAIPSVGDIIAKMNADGHNINFFRNSAIYKSIHTKEAGISRRGDNSSVWRFRFGRNFQKGGFTSKEEAIIFKYKYLYEITSDKPNLRNGYDSW